MPADELLDAVLRPEAAARPAAAGVVSVLPADAEPGAYDRRAAVYDRLVSSRPYNRLLWSTRPAEYRAFAARAAGAGAGPLLDVAAGSASFTATSYSRVARPCVLVDRSLGMLERAAARLPRTERIVLLQADLEDLPFQPGRFETVLSMGVLHLVEDVAGTVRRLAAQVASGGALFLSGLVAETAVGRRYLRLLHRAGEISAPRSETQMRALVADGLDGTGLEWRRSGSMVYAVASPGPGA